MKGKLRWVTAIVVVVLIVGIGYRLFFQKDKVVQYETRPTVSVEYPAAGNITLYTEIVGEIEPQSKVTVLPKMSGELLDIYFQAGDYVEAGQVLCRIDSDALTSLQLNVDTAKVALNDANTSLHRIQALYDSGDVPQSNLEQAQSAASNARFAYEAALDQYNLHVEYMTITAPISGYVESRNVKVHDNVTPGTEICVISVNDQFQAVFGVTEKILQNLSVGDKVALEKNGTEYEAAVTEISSMVNPSTGLYDITAVLTEASSLTTGTRVKITLIMDRVTNVLTVPIDAVNYNNSIAFVYCYNNGIAEKTDIVTGIYDSERMEVVSGITKDSRIITGWSNELVDGAEVIEAASAAN